MTIAERIALLKESGGKAEMDEFIGEFKPLIMSSVSKITGKYVDDSNDEEYSIGLMAFYEAVKSYDSEKGDFIGFARNVISRRVIDFLRKENRFQKIHVMTDFNEEQDEDSDEYMANASIDAYKTGSDNEMLKIEIERLKEELSLWGLSFKDLLKESPKHKSTRELYRDVVFRITESPEIMEIIQKKRYIPIKKICEELQITPKKIEHVRTYIIAAIILHTGDYQYLVEYIGMRGK
jgi:RNA polymerase sigma factor